MIDSFEIVIVGFNCPDFLRIQCDCIRRHLTDEHKLMVVDNSLPEHSSEMKKVCEEFDVGYERPPKGCSSNLPSTSHGMALDWFVKCAGRGRFLGVLDHDIFPFREVNMLPILERHVICGRIHKDRYWWPGCFFVDRLRVPSLDFVPLPGKDTGAGWDWPSSLHRNAKCMLMRDIKISDGDAQRNHMSIIDERWVHLINGSYWGGQFSGEKLKKVSVVLKSLTDGTFTGEIS